MFLRVLAGLSAVYLLNATGRALHRQLSGDRLFPLALGLACLALWAANRRLARPGDTPPSTSDYRFRVWLVAALCLGMYVGWGALIQIVPRSDFHEFHTSAVAFVGSPSLGTLQATKSTTTVLVYSVFVALLGAGELATYVAAATLWAAQLPLLYRALVGFGVDVRTSALATVVYGLAPATLFFAPMLSSEAVFNFLLVLSLSLIARFKTTANIGYVVGTSAAGGLLFLTRTNGVVLFASLGVVCLWIARERRRRILVCAALALPFVLVVSLQAALNHHETGELSVMPSRHGSYNLLAGTNRASRGSYSREDEVLAGFIGPNRVSFKQASANARRIAFERISADPLDFLHFALTKKVAGMWETDAHGAIWSTTSSPLKAQLRSSFASRAMRLSTDGLYVLVLLLATAFFVLMAYRPSAIQVPGQVLWLLTTPILLVGLLHIVIESKSRYHVPLMPFAYVACMLALRHFLSTRRGQRNG